MAAAAGVVVAARALPILVASPASATQSACTNYVATHGYLAGPKAKGVCSNGAIDTGAGKMTNPACVEALGRVGAKAEVSLPACRRA